MAGDPVPLGIDGLTLASGSGADFDISHNGTLVYVPAMMSALLNLAWVDRQGREEPLSAPPARYMYPRISPDGTRIAVDIHGPRDIYIWDLERESLDRLVDHPGEDLFAEWHPDGRRVFFSSNRNGPFNIFSRVADGTGSDELVHATPATQMLMALTPVGDLLLVSQVREGASDFDLVTMTTQEPVRSQPVLSTTNQELNGVISPDGKWVAYQTDASGQWEVYVGPFPDLARQRWKISIDGGAEPLWSRTGDELFYRAPRGAMMSVAVRSTPSFGIGEVTEMFRLEGQGYTATNVGGRSYDISPLDGRFLMSRPAGSDAGNGITVILNWLGELAQRVPAR